MANVKLSTKAVGSTVKIKVNGAAKDFIIVHQGKPSSIYDDSCNGTWVLLKDIYTTSTFGNSNSYKDSSIHSYLNSTFYNLIDSEIRAAIKHVQFCSPILPCIPPCGEREYAEEWGLLL